VAHATTEEGMRRAVLAGVSTIEHGDEGTAPIFALMKAKNVALCPTLSAGEAMSEYREGWRRGIDPDPKRVREKKASFALALKAGVTICFGGDVGVFTHGENARELVAMVAYGMSPLAVLQSATSVNADVFGRSNSIGRIKKGLLADIIAVTGNPLQDIQYMRQVKFVMKGGIVYKLLN
jgi:imidazolonepropionase-like amidohydrolase